MRRETPDHQVVQGASLYINLENLGIFSIPLEEKKVIFSDTVKVFSRLSEDDVRSVCQNISYNRFIDKLVDEGLKLNHLGKIEILAVQ